jgi:hypothetical protein
MGVVAIPHDLFVDILPNQPIEDFESRGPAGAGFRDLARPPQEAGRTTKLTCAMLLKQV